MNLMEAPVLNVGGEVTKSDIRTKFPENLFVHHLHNLAFLLSF